MSVARSHRLAGAVVAVCCVAAVTVYGELSPQALVAVGLTGLLAAGYGVTIRAGEAAPPIGRRGAVWLFWLAAAGAWELVTLAHDGLPTVSDLADPVLAHPAARCAAALGWVAVGAWLVSRPRDPREPG
ncbi:hypothetical protein E4P40_10310 [Blastococcus sp. CT_GayMR20]|nr:hypothetical protein E4P40_10310 [Blastococcus sp. CT_GayMR20]